MAKPQLEDGYTKIANDILEALARIRIPGEAMQVLLTIFRQTYGWNQKEAEISLREFQNITGLNKPHICMAITKLNAMNIIITEKGNVTEKGNITEKGNGNAVTYGFQKDFEKWNPLPKKVTLPKKVMEALPKKVMHSNIVLKKKERKKNTDAHFVAFWNSYPKKKSKNEALKAFCKINPDERLLSVMLSAIALARTSEDWQKEKGKYIPYPATWLNGRRWEDEETEESRYEHSVSRSQRNFTDEEDVIIDPSTGNPAETIILPPKIRKTIQEKFKEMAD